ncbi:hypothetical protein [Lentisphaera araneosa]|jgi:hypothetical protein|uniref:hypothetical protein n=1 Tax=Lentisphaera araneosa TaxID=256847 RepID=UPI000592B70F|nr:hypothetical protein [Lentisphaera araneosa]
MFDLSRPLLLNITKAEKSFYEVGALGIFIFCCLMLIIALSACFGVYTVLRTQSVLRGSRDLNQLTGRLFLQGIMTYVVFILAIFMSKKLPMDKCLLCLPILIFYIYLLLHGFTSLCHCIGEKILSNINSPRLGSAFYAVIYASVALLLIGCIPFLGWGLMAVMTIPALGVSVQKLFIKAD